MVFKGVCFCVRAVSESTNMPPIPAAADRQVPPEGSRVFLFNLTLGSYLFSFKSSVSHCPLNAQHIHCQENVFEHPSFHHFFGFILMHLWVRH